MLLAFFAAVAPAAADDGTLKIRAVDVWKQPWWAREQLPVNCKISSLAVHCDNGLSAAQTALFPLLAPGLFAAPSPNDRSWQGHFTGESGVGGSISGTIAFNVEDGSNIVSAVSHADAGGGSWRAPIWDRPGYDDRQVAFDRAAGVPISVHDVWTFAPTESDFNQVSLDLRLVKDSAAAH